MTSFQNRAKYQILNFTDSSTQIVEAIWPTSSVVCREDATSSSVLPLRTFIQETLRRSRTSYSTLQVALYYLVLIKDQLPARDFTMEQTDDCHASRALQCGRRMFLAALILASKYLQDRNYSARAWSKISGLNTHEINQNEVAFLLAVNWNLHITDRVYNCWAHQVMKHSPSQPPSPGSGLANMEYERRCEDFKRIILDLHPDLSNLDDVLAMGHVSPVPSLSPRSLSPRSLLAAVQDEPINYIDYGFNATPTPRLHRAPSFMEPSPSSATTVGRLAPTFGLLPTPRLTPQISAVRDCSPTGSFAPTSAMSLAVNAACSVQSLCLDRWPITSSPQNYFTTPRRSSLANSVSTVSSPESMVSDSSRASSISSASSLTSAPCSKLEVQARCRSAKLMSERCAVVPSVSSIYEDKDSSSPALYTSAWGPTSLESYMRKTEFEVDSTNEAARALQELHYQWQHSRNSQVPATSAPMTGNKRSRPLSMDKGLQENVREMLRGDVRQPSLAVQHLENLRAVTDRRKRLCCSAEADPWQMTAVHRPTMNGLVGPGMWADILN